VPYITIYYHRNPYIAVSSGHKLGTVHYSTAVQIKRYFGIAVNLFRAPLLNFFSKSGDRQKIAKIANQSTIVD
jgi:hypothetical protein